MEKRLVHLDLVRGLAAIAVMVGHLRGFWFVNYESLPAHSLFDKIFYFFTGLGHQAVMVFFVLSGFFIAGSVSNAFDRNKWSWADYAINRLARLWVVLIPALIVTLVLDGIGTALTHGAGYDGRYRELVCSGPSVNEPANLGIATFFGNIFFLQTIATPVYGSNGPLWSLANEFWYYLLFPLLLQLFHPRSNLGMRVVGGAVSVVLIFWLPKGLVVAGLVWLFGYGAFLLASTNSIFRICRTRLFFLVSLTGFCLCLGLARFGRLEYGDHLVGLAFAGMIPFLANQKCGIKIYETSAVHLSNVSYTLYLSHFPLVAFLFYCFLPKARWFPTLPSYLGYGFCLIGVLIYAFVLWWLFERRTPEVRGFLKRLFKMQLRSKQL